MLIADGFDRYWSTDVWKSGEHYPVPAKIPDFCNQAATGSKVSLRVWMMMMWFWSHAVSHAKQCKVAKSTAITFYQWFREICSWKLLQSNIVLGGAGKIVHIDESLFGHHAKGIYLTLRNQCQINTFTIRCKKKIKEIKGVQGGHLPEYLDEFMWRERYGKTDEEAFENLTSDIASRYPPPP